MTFHGLVDVKRVHTGGIKAGQPHIPHDHQLERVGIVLHAFCQLLALFFSGVVLGKYRAVTAGCGHHHFDNAFVQCVIVPFRAQLDDFGVQVGSNAPRHTNHHAFALKDFLTGFKVRHDVLGNVTDTRRATDQGFHLRPFRFGALGSGKVFFCQIFIQFSDQLLAFIAQGNFSKAAFVENPHGCAVFHRLGNVVDVHVIAEHCRSVYVSFFNGSARKAKVGSIG